jgi:hypothetical protein
MAGIDGKRGFTSFPLFVIDPYSAPIHCATLS